MRPSLVRFLGVWDDHRWRSISIRIRVIRQIHRCDLVLILAQLPSGLWDFMLTWLTPIIRIRCLRGLILRIIRGLGADASFWPQEDSE